MLIENDYKRLYTFKKGFLIHLTYY